MKKSTSIIILIFLSISFSISSCSDSEKRLSPLLNQTKVILDLGLPSAHAVNDNTIWNKIRRLFIRDAIAQSAPASFSSILVRVTGPDIGVTEQSFLPYGAISLNVASGSFRQFDVTAFVAQGSPSAALSFRGLAIANLPAGQTVSVPVAMALNETKILVPDNAVSFSSGFLGRIAVIDDMIGSNWTTITAASLTDKGFSGTLKPYDISFDSRGRIYIANNQTPGVIRIDDINGTNLIQSTTTPTFIFGGIVNCISIAVDRVNNLVYYAQTANLYQSNLDGSNHLPINITGMSQPTIQQIRGIDVDNNGMILMALTYGTPTFAHAILRIDPKTGGVISECNSTSNPTFNLNTPWDVYVRSPYIYVANLGNINAGAGYKILQLTIDSSNAFVLADHNGSRPTQPATPADGVFFGPSRFLAIRNDVLIVADSYQIGVPPNDFERLVSFGNMSFSGWTTYGSLNNTSPAAPAVGLFRLYCQC